MVLTITAGPTLKITMPAIVHLQASTGLNSQFREAFYVMEAEHTELSRIVNDKKGLAAVINCRNFTQTDSIMKAYGKLIEGHSAGTAAAKTRLQRAELLTIAEQEQINVLQPLIYNDPKLKETMDMNHQFSRQTAGWISPKFKVIYSAGGSNTVAELETVFDPPEGVQDTVFGNRESLPNQADRMKFVGRIATDFNRLMREKPGYMDGEIRRIHKWLNA